MRTLHKSVVSADIKKQIIERIQHEGAPVSQIAEEHGIATRTIYDWLAKGAIAVPGWTELSKFKRENDELLKLIGRLTLELSSLKKKI